jgi:signal peptidase I
MRRGMALLGLTVLVVTGCGKASTMTVVVAVPTPASSQATPEEVYRVPSGSMAPTYTVGSHALVRPLVSLPTVGDIVVFHPPEGAEQEECGPTPHVIKLGGAACSAPLSQESSVKFIKRIVAGPGDEIYITEGHVYRKAAGMSQFVREKDPYIRECGASPECNFPTPIRIPAGYWFMMGDNRGESDDSRFWGPVPTEWIIGVARPCAVVLDIVRTCVGTG